MTQKLAPMRMLETTARTKPTKRSSIPPCPEPDNDDDDDDATTAAAVAVATAPNGSEGSDMETLGGGVICVTRTRKKKSGVVSHRT